MGFNILESYFTTLSKLSCITFLISPKNGALLGSLFLGKPCSSIRLFKPVEIMQSHHHVCLWTSEKYEK